MKMKLGKKSVVISMLSAVLVSGALLANTSFAAATKKNLEVYYNNIKVKYNNQEVSIDASLEPFLVDGSTFIPLRKMGEVFGKKVTWDAATYTVNVEDASPAADQSKVDELNSQIESLKAQLATATSQVAEKDAQIATLQSKVTSLESALAAANNDTDLDDLEDELNDDYEDYKETESKITLSGDEDDITVTVKVDPDVWDDLTSTVQESFLQDIVDDILDEFDDADVAGTVKSNSDSSELLSFTVDSGGDVDIGDTEADLDDLEDELNDDYGTYNSVTLSITLTGDEDDITIKVYMTESEWNSLSSSKQNSLEDALTDAVEDEFEDADVKGYVYDSDDGSKLDSF